MSVITSHSVKFDNAVELLKSAGVCEPGSIKSRSGEVRNYDHVLDYEACAPSVAQEVRDRYKDLGFREYSEETGKMERVRDYTEDELSNLCKFPIYFDEDGDGVHWCVNHGANDTPAMAISKLFPDKVMTYYESTEGHFDGSGYIKDGNLSTKDGRTIDSMISCYSPQPVPGDDKRVRVSLPVDNSDKRFALVYADKNNVQDANLLSGGKRKILCVEDKNADVTVYRQLADGTKTKDVMTYDALREKTHAAMDEYLSKQRGSRPLPKVADSMDTPQAESQMGE